MNNWIKNGLQGWASAILVYLILGNLILLATGQEVFGISFRLFATNFVLGFIPGIIGGKIIKKNWGAYVGGAIFPLLVHVYLFLLGR